MSTKEYKNVTLSGVEYQMCYLSVYKSEDFLKGYQDLIQDGWIMATQTHKSELKRLFTNGKVTPNYKNQLKPSKYKVWLLKPLDHMKIVSPLDRLKVAKSKIELMELAQDLEMTIPEELSKPPQIRKYMKDYLEGETT